MGYSRRLLLAGALVLFACAALPQLARAEEEEDDGDVIVLDAENFDEEIAGKVTILVEFYAPWCGHCKRLAPEYKKAATILLAADPPVPLAKVDCPANSALCQKYGVSGYPTLKIFRDGELSSDYSGPRDANGIASYMKKQSGPSSKELKTKEEFEKFANSIEHSVVAFLTEEEKELTTAFKQAADNLRESFRFAHTTAKEILSEFNFENKVAIFQPPKMRVKLESPRVVFDGKPKKRDIIDFVTSKFMGLAGIRNPDNTKFFDSKKPLGVVYFKLDLEHNPKGANYYRNRVIKVAKALEGQITFAVSNKATYMHEMDEMGLDKEKEVCVGIFDSKGGKYPMSKDFSVDNLKEFAQSFLDGELEPYVKSEPVPEENDGPVTVVVGKNFDEVVNNEERDVLIEFYAPWCGHCKSLAPKYEELGEKLSGDPNIVIAKCDATANDYPSLYEVQGFPTLFWVPAGKKTKPVKYQGGREVSDFIDFIKKNATNPPVITGDKKKKKKKDKVEL